MRNGKGGKASQKGVHARQPGADGCVAARDHRAAERRVRSRRRRGAGPRPCDATGPVTGARPVVMRGEPAAPALLRRGTVWWTALPAPVGSEPGYRRPMVIVQADAFNASHIRTVLAVALTSNLARVEAPGNVRIPAREGGATCAASVPPPRAVCRGCRPIAAQSPPWSSTRRPTWRRRTGPLRRALSDS